MAKCNGRCCLILICVLQLLCTTERLVFDFLGFLWSCILADFLQLIFGLFGLLGAAQYRAKVIIVYTVWSLIWIAWNIFLICLYLNVSTLDRVADKSILSLGVSSSFSWWLENGLGCQHNKTYNQQDEEIRPTEDQVSGCLLEYYYVESLHAAIHCLLALMGFCLSFYVIYVLTEEDDSSQDVRDELEYIKMRYRSPARHSFRDETRVNPGYNSMSPPVRPPISPPEEGNSDDSLNGFDITSSGRRMLHKPPPPRPPPSPFLNQTEFQTVDSRHQLVFPSPPGQTII